MEPTTEQPRVKKTADKTAYMREYMKSYRLANLEKCREQDRAKYWRRKPDGDIERKKKLEQMVLSALTQYPEILDSI